MALANIDDQAFILMKLDCSVQVAQKVFRLLKARQSLSFYQALINILCRLKQSLYVARMSPFTAELADTIDQLRSDDQLHSSSLLLTTTKFE